MSYFVHVPKVNTTINAVILLLNQIIVKKVATREDKNLST